MFGYELDFQSPWYLLLLGLLPVLWLFSFRSLSGLGNIRRLIALGCRTFVLTMLIFRDRGSGSTRSGADTRAS